VQYSPRLEDLNEDAVFHIDLNIAQDDFDDLWIRDQSRIPQQFFFEVEQLRDDVWDVDEAQDAQVLIVSYGYEATSGVREEPSEPSEELFPEPPDPSQPKLAQLQQLTLSVLLIILGLLVAVFLFGASRH
jgi:hypothetical protein